MRSVTPAPRRAMIGEHNGKPIIQRAEPATCEDCGRLVTHYHPTEVLERGDYCIPKPIPPWDWYMVHDEIWEEAGMDQGFLHAACLELRLGRKLTSADFPDYPVNEPDSLDSPALAAARRRRP